MFEIPETEHPPEIHVAGAGRAGIAALVSLQQAQVPGVTRYVAIGDQGSDLEAVSADLKMLIQPAGLCPDDLKGIGPSHADVFLIALDMTDPTIRVLEPTLAKMLTEALRITVCVAFYDAEHGSPSLERSPISDLKNRWRVVVPLPLPTTRTDRLDCCNPAVGRSVTLKDVYDCLPRGLVKPHIWRIVYQNILWPLQEASDYSMAWGMGAGRDCVEKAVADLLACCRERDCDLHGASLLVIGFQGSEHVLTRSVMESVTRRLRTLAGPDCWCHPHAFHDFSHGEFLRVTMMFR